MVDQAKENINVEVGAGGGALDKIQKEFEIGESKLSKKELEEATKKAAELMELEKNFEPKKVDKQVNTTQGQQTQRKTGIERAKSNKDNIANIEKAIAGGNIPKDIQAPGKGPIKRLQGFIKFILGTKNLE